MEKQKGEEETARKVVEKYKLIITKNQYTAKI
jgi:hypothetical protein